MSRARLLRLEGYAGELELGPGCQQRRLCDFVTCARTAEYRAVYTDGSWSYLCPEHATGQAQAHGWPDEAGPAGD